ncbi:hypothetical protein FQA45_01385 [Glutamicibacter halophytocola]|uniref:Uncharacterized protein n=1 Tax=Glutamicibacter halophytocola TaxID=1933880 RepID=A0ABX5Y6T6_9MICC|nr:hypothetical protein FQA45_01385 [Glutamicibacter halophytocola]
MNSKTFEVPENDLSIVQSSVAKDIRSEMNREVMRYIQRQRPEYVIFDFFGDTRFGAARLNDGTIVTRNEWKLCKTDFYRQNVDVEFFPGTDEYFNKWTSAAQLAVENIRHYSPETRIILHDVEFVTKYRTKNGEVRSFANSASLSGLNNWWSKLNAYFAEHFADDVICVRTPDLMSFEGHPWGVYGVHYELDYHAHFLNSLIRLALVDSRTSYANY